MGNVKSFKRKMLLWTSNWSKENLEQSYTDQVPFTPDAVEIACLLQATGFRIRFMDRSLPKEIHPVPGVPADHPACRVIIMCPRSGVRMELDAPTSSCKCPSPDKSHLGQSWAVSETIREEMIKAVDFIAPKPSIEISISVSQLIGGLFHVMGMFPDLNQNDIKNETVESRVSSNISMQQIRSATSTCERNSPMKTPATGIAVVTPNAPCVPKASPGDSKTVKPGRYRSLDTLIASDGLRDDLPEPGQLTPKDEEKSGPITDMEVDGEFDTTMYITVESDTTVSQGPGSASKKFMSKSSPAVNCRGNFQRSNTFTLEAEEEERDPQAKEIKRPKLLHSNIFDMDDLGNKVCKDEPRVGPPPQRTPSPLDPPPSSQSSFVLSKLLEIQVAVSDAIFMIAGNEKNLSNIGDVSKTSKAVAGAVQSIITENAVRPIRCLSDFGSVPNLNRAATTVRSIPRPSMRRYTTAFAAPATPTTSRRGVMSSGVERTRRVSTAALSKPSTTSKMNCNRSAAATGSTLAKIDPSPSSTESRSASKEKETISNASSDKKPAHIQSGIPKPGSIRK